MPTEKMGSPNPKARGPDLFARSRKYSAGGVGRAPTHCYRGSSEGALNGLAFASQTRALANSHLPGRLNHGRLTIRHENCRELLSFGSLGPTPPRIHMATLAMFAHRRSRLRPRGFTLVELMIVVCIIALFAGIAAPAVVGQVRDQRTVKSVQTVMNMFREARARSLGRGAAILVGYEQGVFPAPASFYSLESVDPHGVPFSQCTSTAWNATPLGVQTAATPWINGFSSQTDGKANVDFKASFVAAFIVVNNPPVLQLCFSPQGRVFVRSSKALGAAWAPVSGRVEFTAQTQGSSGTPVGIKRKFYVSSDGTTRML